MTIIDHSKTYRRKRNHKETKATIAATAIVVLYMIVGFFAIGIIQP